MQLLQWGLSLDVVTSPTIEFLELRACSERIKGRHALKWGTCSYSNTEQQYSIQWQDREKVLVARQRKSVGFKVTVSGDSGAGGLVVPLPCTAYFGKLAIILIVWLFLATASVCARPSLLSQPSLT